MVSFGIKDDSTFEEGMVERFGCKVFAFDPTLSYDFLSSKKMQVFLLNLRR